MSEALIKGWCPGALRPMRAGDGWVVRLRPRLARLTASQALALCDAADAFGAGLIDLTNRANLQIRGVTESALPVLQGRLDEIGLLDPDATTEGRRNIMVAPDWQDGDETSRIAAELAARLSEFPALPPKVGIAVDAGSGPILSENPADFRIECGAAGGLILRAEGRAFGARLGRGDEVDTLIRLAQWFVSSGGTDAGRMADHRATLPDWARWNAAPARPRARLPLGMSDLGLGVGAAFGQMRAAALAALVRQSGSPALRITPWRMILLEESRPLSGSIPDGLLLSADASVLRVDACTGAPGCPQALGETRALALRLAPFVRGSLHVSGCTKGCARARHADVTLTARPGGFDLIRSGRAGDPPQESGLSVGQVLARFGAS